MCFNVSRKNKIALIALLAISLNGFGTQKGEAKSAAKGPANPIPEMKMIHISAGSFLMGTPDSMGPPDSYTATHGGDEHPQHSVYLSAYSIGKYEVTRGEYRQFINAGGYSKRAYWSRAGWSWKVSKNRTEPLYWLSETINWATGTFTQTDNHPVVGVSYYEAEAFSNWAGGHLPTEAQWERAARWTGSSSRVYPWGDDWNPEYCNNFWDSNPAGGGYNRYQTAPVGSYSSYGSPSGCQDMAGNVQEWCKDWYKSYPESSYQFDFTDSYRVSRGGSWDNYNPNYQCASRYWSGPSGCNKSSGFRLAR